MSFPTLLINKNRTLTSKDIERIWWPVTSVHTELTFQRPTADLLQFVFFSQVPWYSQILEVYRVHFLISWTQSPQVVVTFLVNAYIGLGTVCMNMVYNIVSNYSSGTLRISELYKHIEAIWGEEGVGDHELARENHNHGLWILVIHGSKSNEKVQFFVLYGCNLCHGFPDYRVLMLGRDFDAHFRVSRIQKS